MLFPRLRSEGFDFLPIFGSLNSLNLREVLVLDIHKIHMGGLIPIDVRLHGLLTTLVREVDVEEHGYIVVGTTLIQYLPQQFALVIVGIRLGLSGGAEHCQCNDC